MARSLSPPCAIPALPTQSCVPPDTSHLPRASLPLLQGRGNRGPLAGSRGDSDHGPAPPSGEGHLVVWSHAAVAIGPPSARANYHKEGDTKAGHKARHGTYKRMPVSLWPGPGGREPRCGPPTSPTWASVSGPWAVGGGKGELAGVLLLEGVEAGPRGRTCCLGRSSAAWLASPASPPGGPQEARRRPTATPWPASPLGGQTDGRMRAILTPMLPHGRWNLLGWGAQAGRPGAKPLACLHL